MDASGLFALRRVGTPSRCFGTARGAKARASFASSIRLLPLSYRELLWVSLAKAREFLGYLRARSEFTPRPAERIRLASSLRAAPSHVGHDGSKLLRCRSVPDSAFWNPKGQSVQDLIGAGRGSVACRDNAMQCDVGRTLRLVRAHPRLHSKGAGGERGTERRR